MLEILVVAACLILVGCAYLIGSALFGRGGTKSLQE